MQFSRGIATFGLDYGKCPKWLFERMVKLSREMIEVIIKEYGPDEFVKRIADPVWFQSLGTVLAFDWNASGLTTTLTAALKEAIRGREKEYGIYICGGKGKTSRKTPQEILSWGHTLNIPFEQANKLVYNSKMVAKVDNSLVQDGFQIYHHTFFFSYPLNGQGSWAVVQQGMNEKEVTARRYHWYSSQLDFHSLIGSKSLVLEPHQGIVADQRKKVLNLVSQKSIPTQNTSVELVNQNFVSLLKDVKLLAKYSTEFNQMIRLGNKKQQLTLLNLENKEFKYQPVVNENFLGNRYLHKVLYQLTETKPKKYEDLLSIYGVGPKTIRALALVAEVIYGAKPSYEDPARYSFAHGGKDATPYPVDRETYDNTIRLINSLVLKTKLPISEKTKILKRNQ
ncbi:MAG: DUF763 domain-containing protein [Parcubacteria group bacterium]|nr:DUF763 domain-containing protein [Parcubacteria group bacterium]